MSTSITIVVTRPNGVPVIKASGDISAFLEILPDPASGEAFFVAVSDGTLLRGAAGEGFRLEMVGNAVVKIDGDVATLDAPVEWISVGRTWADHPVRCTAEETARIRAEQAVPLHPDQEELERSINLGTYWTDLSEEELTEASSTTNT